MMRTNADGRTAGGAGVTLSEAVDELGGAVSRATLERAVQRGELRARRGRGRGGKVALVVERGELRRWYEARSAVGRAGGVAGADIIINGDADVSDGRAAAAADDDDDDDVMMMTAHGARHVPGGALEELHRAGLAELGRQMQPLQQRLEQGALRLGRAEAERDALRMRALAAEEEVRRLRVRVEVLERELAREQERGGWLRRLLGG